MRKSKKFYRVWVKREMLFCFDIDAMNETHAEDIALELAKNTDDEHGFDRYDSIDGLEIEDGDD